MEQNYTQSRNGSQIFNEDALFMAQVVGQDYELLLVDALLRDAFGSKTELN